MKTAFELGRVAGIPIRVHFTLLLLFPYFANNFSVVATRYAPAWGALAAVLFFAGIALHELGHSLVAMAFGCRVRKILLMPIGGVAELERAPRRPAQEALMAAAGPAVSGALAFGFHALAAHPVWGAAVTPRVMCAALGWINGMLAFFNLVPAFPMDGGRILRAALTPFRGRLGATAFAARLGRLLAVLFGLWGLFGGFDIFKIVIAFFIYQAAGAEYRAVALDEARRRGMPPPFPFVGFPPPPAHAEDPGEITVSPPPYER